MDEAGPIAIRKKRDSSLNVAMRMLAEGEVDGVMSAETHPRSLPRPSIMWNCSPGCGARAGGFLSDRNREAVLLDAGAHAQAGTVHLAQSAALAHIYLKVTQGLDRPRIGLLNIGQEPGKGTRAVQRAFRSYQTLRSELYRKHRAQRSFFRSDRCCYIARASSEIICPKNVRRALRRLGPGARQKDRAMQRGEPRRIGPDARDFARSYHYDHGGAPLLGVRNRLLSPTAVRERLLSERDTAYLPGCGQEICRKMSEALEQDSALADFQVL